MDYNSILIKMMKDKYYTSKELMYDAKLDIYMSPFEYKEFLKYKDDLLKKKHYFFKTIDLETFNNSPLFFASSLEYFGKANQYMKLIIDDFDKYDESLFSRNISDITLSKVYSEIEGTLNIESVPTTRKVVEDLAKGKRKPQNKNDQIIFNMIKGIEFVHSLPEFNQENLYTLYNTLSSGCLDDEDVLLSGNLYRHDGVEVGGYSGCPVKDIKKCMDSLFVFVNNNIKNPEYFSILPHIAHYYIAYIHPYFDYNGRTARMVSYWISVLMNKNMIPPVVSEAINQTKGKYYEALSETRDAKNDLTYFLLYIFDVSIKYFLAYKNIEEISQKLTNDKSIIMTPTEKSYYKKILISNKGKFTHNEFTNWVDIRMSKQGALKILNTLESYGLLTSETSKSGNKLFDINFSILIYNINNK